MSFAQIDNDPADNTMIRRIEEDYSFDQHGTGPVAGEIVAPDEDDAASFFRRMSAVKPIQSHPNVNEEEQKRAPEPRQKEKVKQAAHKSEKPKATVTAQKNVPSQDDTVIQRSEESNDSIYSNTFVGAGDSSVAATTNYNLEKSMHYLKFDPEVAQEQPEEMKQQLKDMVINNQFNAYCIDCQKKTSSHANITYGTFICESCAEKHIGIFGMHKHYVKPVFSEFWDPH